MNIGLKDAKILIVDDKISNLEILEDFLKLKGYENIITINDSLNFDATMKDFCPDIILLDLMMPHISGFEILEKLNKDGMISGSMPIIVLSADVNFNTKKSALSSGASDFITKPFDLIEVDLRIKNLLQSAFLLSQIKNQNKILNENVLEKTTELQEIIKDIRKQNDTLKEISWIQSHVVRAPLARMLGLISLIKHESYPENMTQEQILNLIVDSALELDKTILDISNKIIEYQTLETKS